MVTKARFGNNSDWIGRTFGNFIYCIDSSEFCLHVYSVKD